MAATKKPLDTPYTFAEAAKMLGVGQRNMRDIIKRHPSYYRNGARYLFTMQDIEAIRTALRRETQPCRSNSKRPARAARPTGISEAPTGVSTSTAARERLRDLQQSGKDKQPSANANVVPLPRK